MSWSILNGISQSKAVKSVGMWFVIVPIVAKLFSNIEPDLTVTIFGTKFLLNFNLPFQWKFLFLSACAFLIASLIYTFFCPAFVKKYRDYSTFKSAGNSRTQVVMYLADITKPILAKTPSESNRNILEAYSSIYCADITHLPSDSWSAIISKIEMARPQGEDANAFYFLYTLANKQSSLMIFFSFSFYVIGFASLGVIGYQNIMYVLAH